MFDEIRFPEEISFGSRGGPGYRTDIHMLDSGAEERIARLSQARHSYDVAERIKSRDDHAAVKTFFMARQGGLRGFRFKDWLDYASTTNHRTDPTGTSYLDQLIGIGDDSTTQFQLVKEYTSGATTHTRTITKPVSGTVSVGINGVDQASGWSVDTVTGIVTFVTPPGDGLDVTAGFEFDVPVRFSEETDKWLSVVHEEYDFTNASIMLEEISDGIFVADDYPYGNAVDYGTFGDTTAMLSSSVVVQKYAFSTGSKSLLLPPITADMVPGLRFYICNGGGIAFTILDDQAQSIANNSVAGDAGKLVILMHEPVGDSYSWVLI